MGYYGPSCSQNLMGIAAPAPDASPPPPQTAVSPAPGASPAPLPSPSPAPSAYTQSVQLRVMVNTSWSNLLAKQALFINVISTWSGVEATKIKLLAVQPVDPAVAAALPRRRLAGRRLMGLAGRGLQQITTVELDKVQTLDASLSLVPLLPAQAIDLTLKAATKAEQQRLQAMLASAGFQAFWSSVRAEAGAATATPSPSPSPAPSLTPSPTPTTPVPAPAKFLGIFPSMTYFYLAVAGAGLVVIVVIAVAIACCLCRRSRRLAREDAYRVGLKAMGDKMAAATAQQQATANDVDSPARKPLVPPPPPPSGFNKASLLDGWLDGRSPNSRGSPRPSSNNGGSGGAPPEWVQYQPAAPAASPRAPGGAYQATYGGNRGPA